MLSLSHEYRGGAGVVFIVIVIGCVNKTSTCSRAGVVTNQLLKPKKQSVKQTRDPFRRPAWCGAAVLGLEHEQPLVASSMDWDWLEFDDSHTQKSWISAYLVQRVQRRPITSREEYCLLLLEKLWKLQMFTTLLRSNDVDPLTRCSMKSGMDKDPAAAGLIYLGCTCLIWMTIIT